MSHPKITQEVLEQIINDLKQNIPITQIATKYSISRSQVHIYIKKLRAKNLLPPTTPKLTIDSLIDNLQTPTA